MFKGLVSANPVHVLSWWVLNQERTLARTDFELAIIRRPGRSRTISSSRRGRRPFIEVAHPFDEVSGRSQHLTCERHSMLSPPFVSSRATCHACALQAVTRAWWLVQLAAVLRLAALARIEREPRLPASGTPRWEARLVHPSTLPGTTSTGGAGLPQPAPSACPLSKSSPNPSDEHLSLRTEHCTPHHHTTTRVADSPGPHFRSSRPPGLPPGGWCMTNQDERQPNLTFPATPLPWMLRWRRCRFHGSSSDSSRVFPPALFGGLALSRSRPFRGLSLSGR